MNIIVGTAGHIDHGKTSLIKALTGTDTDRLPEEKKRGITIDLGFAELAVEGHRIGFVDVPGHERFVKNMLAGAAGIDLVLLVVAADEGVMPQTREHFDICRLLGIKSGVIALTKSDLVDDEMLDLVRLDVGELAAGTFLEKAPVIPVSSTSGAGLAELKSALVNSAAALGDRHDIHVPRLPIDRSFSVRGFGTVLTGTLASGSLTPESSLELMPERRPVRVRGLQTHGRSVEAATAGQRVAVNLGSIDHADIHRGSTLALAGTLAPATMLDVQVEVLPSAPRPMRSRHRVRVHIGTAEVLARVYVLEAAGEIEPGSEGCVQLRLEAPVAAVVGERFVIRSYSPQATIAGGTVLDPLPVKHSSRDRESAVAFLAAVSDAWESTDKVPAIARLFIEASVERGIAQPLVARTGFRRGLIDAAAATLTSAGVVVDAGGILLAARAFQELRERLARSVKDHHDREPFSAGIARKALQEKHFARIPDEVFRSALAGLVADRTVIHEADVIRLADREQELSAAERGFVERFLAELRTAGLQPRKLSEIVADVTAADVTASHAAKLVEMLAKRGDVIKVSTDLVFAGDVIASLRTRLKDRAALLPGRLIDVAAFKDLAGVSRKYAIPLLEYFDRIGVTKRVGEKRLIT